MTRELRRLLTITSTSFRKFSDKIFLFLCAKVKKKKKSYRKEEIHFKGKICSCLPRSSGGDGLTFTISKSSSRDTNLS